MVLYLILGTEETLLWSILSPEHGRTALPQTGRRSGLRAISTRWWPLKQRFQTNRELVSFITRDLPAALIRKEERALIRGENKIKPPCGSLVPANLLHTLESILPTMRCVWHRVLTKVNVLASHKDAVQEHPSVKVKLLAARKNMVL